MRLATVNIPAGPRLHARGHSGYVDLVRGLARGGASVLIVEQRAKAVLAISDRTYVLASGEVRMEGTPAELGTSPAFVESFLGGAAGSHEA